MLAGRVAVWDNALLRQALDLAELVIEKHLSPTLRGPMAIQHVNRRGDTYFLHQGKTRTGRPMFFFSKDQEGTLVDAIPDGYEIYENPSAQVFLRKIQPRFVTDEEVALVAQAARRHGGFHYLIDVKGKSIVVHEGHMPVLRFSLVDEHTRTFFTERWCFLGSIDDWVPLMGGTGELKALVQKYCPHLGRESFFELM
jgi:hypothetical protein